MRIFLFIILCIITGPGLLRAGIITVAQDGSGDVTTVQEGINLAQANDTVLVMPGTYYENLLIEGKALTLASNYLFSNNPDDMTNTIIDGNHQGCVIAAEDIQEAFTIYGLTIQKGQGVYPNGGGISLIDCDNATVLNSVIQNNFGYIGGGIKLIHTNVYFEGSTIRYNHASKYGGGIYAWDSGYAEFSQENRCNIYMNHAARGSDIQKMEDVDFSTIYADTLTVEDPSVYYIISLDPYGNILADLEIDYQNHKLEKIDADVYVSPEGDNSDSGLSPDAPFRNIWYAMLRVQNDSINPNTVYLAPGTYAPSINNELFPVHCKQNIRIHGNSIDNTILNAEETAGPIWSSGENNFLSLENMELTNGAGDDGGVIIYGLDSVYIKNLLIHNIEARSSGGLRLAETKVSYLENVEVSNVMAVRAMRVNNAKVNTLCKSDIYNLKIQNNEPSSEQTGGGGLSILGKGPNINSMEVNIVNALFTNNYNNETFWSNMGSALAISGYVSLKLINATFADNTAHDGGAIAIHASDGPSDIQVYNSIFANNSPEQISIVGEPSTLKLYHCNLEGGMDDIDIVGDHTVGIDDGTIDIDPVFTTYNGTDYFLAQNSSCIHAGTMDINDFTFPEHDLMGNPRLHGIVDMGAYENPFVPVSTNDLPGLTNNVRVFPNPADGMVSVTVTLEQSDVCVLEIFNNKGERIQQLFEGPLAKGTHTFYLNKAAELPAGVYLYTFKTESTIKTGKIVIE